MAKKRSTTKSGGEDKSPSVPKAPEGKESLLDKAGRYAVYGQLFGNDSANMSMGQRIGGAAYNAFEQATLGQMGTLGKAMSAGLSARGKKDQAGGSGPHDTQDIQFKQIKGDDVVAAINQSTGQMVAGLNTVNHTLGRGFNRLGDDIQAQAQALNSIVAANEDVAIQMRELFEELNKMAYNRGGQGGANASTLAGRPTPNDGMTSSNKGGGGLLGGLLGDVLTGAAAAGGAGLLGKLFGKDGAKTAEKGLGKTALKSLLKKIPGVGLLMGLGFGIGRLMEGDILGAAGEIASGAASTIPGVGTAASLAIDAGLLAKDVSEASKEDAQQQPPEAVTPSLEKEQYAYVNDPGIAGQSGDLGKPGPNHGVRVKLIKKVPSGWVVEYPNGQQAFTGENTLVSSPPTDAPQGPESSLPEPEQNNKTTTSPNYTDDAIRLLQKKRNKEQIQKDLGIPNEADLPAANANPGSGVIADATPVGGEPPGGSQNWDEDFHSKFPEWMNVKDQDYPPSRLMDTPSDTTEEKLKQQEAVAEEAQKKNTSEALFINAKELTFKSDTVTFDTDKLVFKYSQMSEEAASSGASQTDASTYSGPSPPAAGTQVTQSTGAGGAGGVASGFARGGQDVLPGDVTAGGVVPKAPSSITDVIKSAPTPGAGPAQMGTASGAIPQEGFGPAVKDGSNGKLPDSQLAPIGIGGLKAQPSAAAAFKAMRAAAEADGVKLGATDGYRTFAQQVDVKRRKPNLAATPGKSNHGWGLAFDMDFGSNVNSPGYKWMVANAARFGFKGPLRKPNEPWHWEYAGGGGGAPAAPDATQVAQPGGTGEGVTPSTGGGGGAPSPTAGSAGGAPSPMPMPSSGGGGAENPLASMLGGGGSPFGDPGNLAGPVIGSMSKNTSLNAAAPAPAPSTNIFNNTSTPTNAGGNESINPGAPQPAISNMFAKLFDGSAMFG